MFGLCRNRPVARRKAPADPRRARRRRGARPRLEELEGRVVPSSTPLALTGFNQDVIFGAGEASAFAGTTTTLDGFNVLYGAGAGSLPAANGLPASGSFTSATDPSVTFTLQPYAGNNGLFFGGRGPQSAAAMTLTLTSPAAFTALHVLATAAGIKVGATYQVTLNFADGSSAPVTGVAVPDWIRGTSGSFGLAVAITRPPGYNGGARPGS
jgi:hypothetical protein